GDDIECGDDIGVVNTRSESRFVDHGAEKLRLLGQVWMESLDRDGPREACSTEQPAEVHDSHAARGDPVVDRIPADDVRRAFTAQGISSLAESRPSGAQPARSELPRRLLPPSTRTAAVTCRTIACCETRG